MLFFVIHMMTQALISRLWDCNTSISRKPADIIFLDGSSRCIQEALLLFPRGSAHERP